MAYANSGEYRQAVEEFKAALSFVPKYKDAESLVLQYEKAADEQDAEAHYQKGVALMGQKKYEEAQQEFQKAIGYVPSYKDSVQLIGECQNSMPPTQEEVTAVVTALLKREVPMSWVGNLSGGKNAKLKTVKIQKIGIYNEKEQYWPMQIRVVGDAETNDFTNPGRVSFDKVADFKFYRDDYGQWQAKLVGGMMQ